MRIPRENIGNFSSTKQNRAYTKAVELKTEIDRQLEAAPKIDDQVELDHDHQVPGRVRLLNTNPAFKLDPVIGQGGPEYTGCIEFAQDSGSAKRAHLEVKDYSYMNLPEYTVSYQAEDGKQVYQKKDNGLTETVTIDEASGDWELSRKALGFIPLPWN